VGERPRSADRSQWIIHTAGRYRELRPLMRLVDDVENIQVQTGFAYGRM
jgi:hypothetical protein